ncbi:HCLS1-associated protein X-1-like [Pararge aegeria]|uniref:HCLS1-associated protein X-1-like n=1 Tax=Pararge aegeria TaxID=116150 RepID=UPI0019D098C9|nr:HCLS1-associated protein X-1-like [Pararge aegeria]
MSSVVFMDRIRSFFGLRQEPPRNDFRNPIWGSDDDDDDDELYGRNKMEVFDPREMQREFVSHMQEMFKNFGSLFGDMKVFMGQGDIGTITEFPTTEQEPDHFDSNLIRGYYLKPGYQEHKYEHLKEDSDLDGKISSNEISGLLQQKDGIMAPQNPFSGNLVPGRSFCKTIITTSVTKPDGTIETRRIIKNGNEVIEETTTTELDSKNPYNPGFNPVLPTDMMFSQLSSLLRNFY